MTDLLTHKRVVMRVYDSKARSVVDCGWLSESFLQTTVHVK